MYEPFSASWRKEKSKLSLEWQTQTITSCSAPNQTWTLPPVSHNAINLLQQELSCSWFIVDGSINDLFHQVQILFLQRLRVKTLVIIWLKLPISENMLMDFVLVVREILKCLGLTTKMCHWLMQMHQVCICKWKLISINCCILPF